MSSRYNDRDYDRYNDRDDERIGRRSDYEHSRSRYGSEGSYGGSYSEPSRQYSRRFERGRDYGNYGYDRESDYGRDYGDRDYGRESYYGGASGRTGGRRYGYGREGSAGYYGRDYDRGYGNYRRDSDRGYDGERYNQIRSDYGVEERDWWDRASDELASWFGDKEAALRRRMDEVRGGQYRGRGPKGYRRSDDRIKEDINDRLTDHPYLDAYDIDVSVDTGEVTLTGTVDSRHAKRLAEDIAESVSGVSNVQNNLRVSRGTTTGATGIKTTEIGATGMSTAGTGTTGAGRASATAKSAGS